MRYQYGILNKYVGVMWKVENIFAMKWKGNMQGFEEILAFLTNALMSKLPK